MASPKKSHFYSKAAIKLLAICGFGWLSGFLFFNSPYWMAGIWTSIITAFLFFENIRFVSRSERKLTAFLQSIGQSDFTITFSENETLDDYDLNLAFNQLSETFRGLRSARESQHHLLQIIVAHAAVPLICFDETNDEVYLINDAAKNLFQIPFLQKIEPLWRIDRDLPEFLRNIQDTEKSSLKLLIRGKTIFLSVISRHIIFDAKKLKLVGLTDVSSELAAKEAEAWQKLLRVLTHEISNSAIPLSTLSSYIYEMVTQASKENRELSADQRTDILDSLRTIDERSRSLKEFIHNFKSVNQIPEPTMVVVPLQDILGELRHLFARELEKENIELTILSTNIFSINADKNLTMQVLINLTKNAMEAMTNMKHDKKIVISAEMNAPKFISILIADNGCGIPPEEMDQIFIPFYSTKTGGSGIGLSIAHQIMQKQKGNLSVSSVPGHGAVFTVSFPA